MKRIAILLAALLITSPFSGPPLTPSSLAANGVMYVKIGLIYGSNAVPGANLQNSVGSGYRFGYFDADRNFVQLGSTDKTKISVVKNRTVYWDGSNYQDGASGAMVGAFHGDTGVTYESGEEAQAAADDLLASGQPAFVHYTLGKFGVRIGSYAGKETADLVTGSVYCVSVVESGTSNILFQFDSGNTSGLGILPSQGEVVSPVTWCKGYKYYGGFEYCRRDGNNVTVVNVVSVEDYVKGVIPYEMSPSWPVEALKAQALCAKSFAYTSLGKHKSQGFDICNTIDCQVYYGTGNASANSDGAVDAVAGMYILYNGKPIQAVYTSSDGGSTENSENVWTSAIPYLRAVTDNYEDLDTCTNGRWSSTLTNDTLTALLNSKGYANSGIVNMTAEYTAAGNVLALTITDSAGKVFTFKKESARSILNSATYGMHTYSQRYTINAGGAALSVRSANGVSSSIGGQLYVLGSGGELNTVSVSSGIKGAGGVLIGVPQAETSAKGTYVINGTGWGHNVGMSQNGARAMAKLGMTYEDIVTFYYTGVTIGYLE
ncbi:hypothetical protein FACS1894208_03840 [Clostridia bacterium]|nr:hypothetical protein FACS1894208_03840 [Clostridia bacterium]